MIAHTERLSIDTAGRVGVVSIQNPPNNFIDAALVRDLAGSLAELQRSDHRAVVITGGGKHFCAGVDFTGADPSRTRRGADLYREALKMFDIEIPIIAAVNGAAIGGGLGLACVADFRVVTPSSRLSANFVTLGFHHGFGLSVTLPRIVGRQHAATVLLTGRRLNGDEAASIGLADRCVDELLLMSAARELGDEIAAAAPLAVRSIRATLRHGLRSSVEAALRHELGEQQRLRYTDDWAEGVAASSERRTPHFTGR